ncbi:hypothetical protein ACTFO6_19010, partial [Pelomicrobium sp. G1]
RGAIWRLHFSRRTEGAYIHWRKRFIYFFGALASLRAPSERSSATMARKIRPLDGFRYVPDAELQPNSTNAHTTGTFAALTNTAALP